jgi:hypothetical protein
MTLNTTLTSLIYSQCDKKNIWAIKEKWKRFEVNLVVGVVTIFNQCYFKILSLKPN